MNSLGLRRFKVSDFTSVTALARRSCGDSDFGAWIRRRPTFGPRQSARGLCPLHETSTTAGGRLSNARFPLTPTLSPGERGRPCAAFDDSEGFGSSRDGKWFSLSPRERVGVRGNQ